MPQGRCWLTGLIPTIFTALDTVSREQVGFIPAVSRNAKADAAAKDQTVTAPVAPPATTVDITPGATAPNDGDQTIGTVDVKITKSKMAPVKWNGEEQLALGPAGTYNTILADQFKQAFRALANEMDSDLAALYLASSRAVGTAGTTPFGIAGDLSDAANARQVLSDNGSPTTDLQMVLGSSAIANLRGKQSVLFKVNESGTDALLREGIVGRLEGFNIHESAHVKKRAASAATDYLVNGAKSEGDILIAIDKGHVFCSKKKIRPNEGLSESQELFTISYFKELESADWLCEGLNGRPKPRFTEKCTNSCRM